MTSLRNKSALCLLGLLVLSCAGDRPDGFNLLLVSFDTTRADRIGCYGYGRPTTPNLDRLAARAVRFEQAYTPVPITLPAHASLLTGAYPTSHGVRTNGIFSLDGRVPTLAESFTEAGYSTAGFVGAFVMDSRYGLGRGFGLYDDDLVSGGRRSGVLKQRERTAGDVTDSALEWLAANAYNPFFAFVHYFDPHRPFEAPAEFAARFEDPYDAEIAYADSQLGRLLDTLDSLGLAANTVVAVVADHGEGLGEHGESTHANFIYNSTARVPFVLHVPGRPELAGVTSSREVSLVDIAPTVATLCGVEPPSRSQGNRLISSAGELQSGNPPLYLECYYPYYSHGWSPLEGVVRGGFKYVRAPQPELYDLAADPSEQTNLHGQDPSRDTSYRQLLDNLRARITPAEQVSSARTPGAEETSSLRSLGYVAGGHAAPPRDFSSLPDPKEMISMFSAYMLGVTYMADGRLDMAAVEFESILAGDSTNYSVWEFLAETELLRGNPRAAEQAARRATNAPEPTERAWFCLGMSLLEQADTVSAVENLERTLEINPDYGPALAVAARIQEAGGNAELALEYFMRALEVMPGTPELLTDIGSCLLGLGQARQAENYLVQATADPDCGWRAWFDLGVARQMQGDLEGAVAAYNHAAAIPGASPRLHNNLGICLFAMERYGDSERAYRQALRIEPGYAEAWNNLGGSLAAQGDIEPAAQAYSRALEIRPGYADACFNYGLLLAERMGLPDSARALLERGIRLEPDSPRAKKIADFAGKL